MRTKGTPGSPAFRGYCQSPCTFGPLVHACADLYTTVPPTVLRRKDTAQCLDQTTGRIDRDDDPTIEVRVDQEIDGLDQIGRGLERQLAGEKDLGVMRAESEPECCINLLRKGSSAP